MSHVKDAAFTLEDLETIKVLGKGSGGVVQLARHKWTGQFFAVKVSHIFVSVSFLDYKWSLLWITFVHGMFIKLIYVYGCSAGSCIHGMLIKCTCSCMFLRSSQLMYVYTICVWHAHHCMLMSIRGPSGSLCLSVHTLLAYLCTCIASTSYNLQCL